MIYFPPKFSHDLQSTRVCEWKPGQFDKGKHFLDKNKQKKCFDGILAIGESNKVNQTKKAMITHVKSFKFA